MACSISIENLVAIVGSNGTSVELVRVSGTAQECEQVVVRIVSTGIRPNPVMVDVVAGQWQLEIPAAEFEGEVRCGQKIAVVVQCRGNERCEAHFADKPLRCSNPCPTFELKVLSVADQCEDGRRIVTLQAVVHTDVTPTVVEWDFGDGSDGTSQVVTDGQTITVDHPYLVGSNYDATLNVTFPLNCQSPTLRITGLAPCPAIECPSTARLRLVGTNGRPVRLGPDGCVPRGRYRVRVVEPTGDDLRYTWSRNGERDGTYTEDSYPLAVGANADPFTISVSVDRPDDPECPPLSAAIEIKACNTCPPGLQIAAASVGACDANGQIAVVWRVSKGASSVDPQVQVDFGDGTSTAPFQLGAGAASVDLPAHAYAGAGNPTATVRVIDPPNCDPASSELQLSPCRETPPPPPPEIDWCSILLFMTMLMFGIFVLSVALVLCPAFVMGAPPEYVILGAAIAAAASGVFFMIALLLWSIVCRPNLCDLLGLAWKLLFLGGVVGIYYFACPACLHVGVMGAVMLLMAVGAFVTWLSVCRPNVCSVFNQLVLLTMVFDIVALLNLVLGWCVLASAPVLAGVYAAAVAAFNIFAITGQQRYCRITPLATLSGLSSARMALVNTPAGEATAATIAARAPATPEPKHKCKCQDHPH